LIIGTNAVCEPLANGMAVRLNGFRRILILKL